MAIHVSPWWSGGATNGLRGILAANILAEPLSRASEANCPSARAPSARQPNTDSNAPLLDIDRRIRRSLPACRRRTCFHAMMAGNRSDRTSNTCQLSYRTRSPCCRTWSHLFPHRSTSFHAGTLLVCEQGSTIGSHLTLRKSGIDRTAGSKPTRCYGDQPQTEQTVAVTS